MIVQDYATTRHARWLHRMLDWQVAAYVPCSQDVRRNLLAVGVPDWKIHPVDNPADFDPTIRTGNRNGDRDELTIGIVGQVIERKGHHVVVEAMTRIRERHPELRYRLKVFGDGPAEYIHRVRTLAEAGGVADRIDWCGYRSSKDDIYPEVDFTLVPTITPDPAPLASIEPAVYGKPTIGATVGGIPEIIRDGVTGYLVPPSDPIALAERMVQFLRDPSRIRMFGEQAHADYKDRFSSDRFVTQFQDVVDRCVPDAGKQHSMATEFNR